MTVLSTPMSSIQIKYNANTISFTATNMEVNRPVTEEVSSLYFKGPFPYEDTIPIGATITAWLGRGTLNKVFAGRINSYTKTIEGHKPRYIEGEASGWGNVLNYSYVTGIKEGYGHEILAYLVDPLINLGYLSGKTIVPTTIKMKKSWADSTRADAIRDVTKDIDYDWYVDLGGTFRAFPIDSIVKSYTIDDKILTYSYTKSDERLINVQTVIGGYGKTLTFDGTLCNDANLTESLTDWSSPDSTLSLDTEYTTIGTYSIKAESSTDPNPTFRRGFPNTLDLDKGGELIFYVRYEGVERKIHEKDYIELDIYFKTDANNGFWTTRKLTGGYAEIPEVVPPVPIAKFLDMYRKKYTVPWTKVNVPFNLCGGELKKFGSPYWSNISTITISIKSPLSATDLERMSCWIDGMSITGRYSGEYQDSTSVARFGEHRGPLILESELTLDTQCEALAQRIIQAYAYPIGVLDEVTTYGDFSYNEGDYCTISAREMTIATSIRNIRHRLDNFKFTTTYELAPRYIPSIEKILAKLITDTEETRRGLIYEREGIPLEALSGIYTKPLGPDIVDLAIEPDNLIRNPHFEYDTNLDGIPDYWTVNGTGGRSDTYSFKGKYSGSLSGTSSLNSYAFGTRPEMNAIAGGWLKRESGTGGFRVVYFDINRDPISTITICSQEFPIKWSFYYDVHDTPSNSKFAVFQCINDSGIGYYDDVFYRLKAPPAIETRLAISNLIINGGFERDWDNDGIPDWWKWIQISGTPTSHWDDTLSKYGTRSQSMTIGTGECGRLTYLLKEYVVAGEEYIGSGYFRSAAPISSGVTFAVIWYDGNENIISTVSVWNTSTEVSGTIISTWGLKDGIITAPTNAKKLSTYIQADLATANTIWVDAIDIRRWVGWEQYFSDEYERSTNEVSFTDICVEENFLVSRTFKPQRMKFGIKIKSDVAGDTIEARITIDNIPKLGGVAGYGGVQWYTDQTTYQYFEGTIDSSYLSEGRHKIALQLQSPISTVNAYETFYEMFLRR